MTAYSNAAHSRRLRSAVAAILGFAGAVAASPGSAATYVLQAEQAEVVRGVAEKAYGGYTGSGFVNYANEAGSYVEWIVEADAEVSGVGLKLRYANGASSGRPMRILVNGALVGTTQAFGPTGSWSTWSSKALGTVALRRGFNTIRAEASGSGGGPNVDRLSIESSLPVRLSDWGRALTVSTLARFPDPAVLGDSTHAERWHYAQAMFLLAMDQTRRRTSGPDAWLQYARDWMDIRVDTSGLIVRTTDPRPSLPSYLDTVMPGRLALLLDREFGSVDARYRLAAEKLWQGLDIHRRLPAPDLILSHTNGRPNEVLLDGTYMALPFMAEYGTARGLALTGYPDLAADIGGHFVRLRQRLLDKTGTDALATGLLYQAFDASGRATWIVPGTRQSGAFWLRGVAWYLMALVDCLDSAAFTSAQRTQLVGILGEVAAGLAGGVDPATGLWFNVVRLDAANGGNTIPGNFIETSGSAMAVYALSKAIQRTWLPDSYKSVASRAYKGLLTRLSLQPADIGGSVQYLTNLTGISPGQLPKATAADYLLLPTVDNEPHGLGAFLLMYEQVRRAPKSIAP